MLPGSSGSIPIPRKMSGSAINTIDVSIVAIRTPSVVFDSAIHLYPSWSGCPGGAEPSSSRPAGADRFGRPRSAASPPVPLAIDVVGFI